MTRIPFRPPTPGPAYDMADESQFRALVRRTFETLTLYPDREGSLTLPSGDTDDLEILELTLLRVTPDGAGSTITGIGSGRPGRVLRLISLGANLTLAHQGAGSAAGNRLLSQTGGDVTLGANELATLVYDGTTARWRL